MGSQIITTLVAQIGQATVNPDNLSPSPSKPIEQVTNFSASSEPIQLFQNFKTASGGSGDFSNPIEQKEADSFNKAETRPDDCFIEQIRIERNETGEDTPIEQVVSVTDNLRDGSAPDSNPIEQRILVRDSVGDEPIQQEPVISNTVQVTQFDFIDTIFPACNSTKNPVSTSILWRILDFGFPFDIGTLIFRVQGIQVQNTSDFTVTAIVNGLQLDYNPPADFSFNTDIDIILTISDSAVPPNPFTFLCTWRTVQDTRPPVISLTSPLCDATDVSVTAPVKFRVLDVGDGVDQDSIKFSVEGLDVCTGLTFDPITVVSGSGFDVTWTHADNPFRFDSTVSVAIRATDLSTLTNSSFFVCCFQTESSTAPTFINFDPAQCSTFVDNRTGLTFEIYGNIDGLDISTLEVRVDNNLRKVFVRPRLLRSE